MYNFDEIIDRRHMRSAKWDIAEDCLSLGVADMDFRSPYEIQSTLLQDLAIGNYGYKNGTWEAFRDAAIAWEKRRHGIELKPEWMTFAPGVIAGMAQAFYTLTKPGDRVVILTPVYGPFFMLSSMDGRERVECPLLHDEQGWHVDFDLLEKKCTGAKVFFLCSPHNPVGRVWTRVELKTMCEICRRTGCLLFSDEIHHDLILDGREFVTAADADPGFAEQIVSAAAPSKTFNIPGFGASYVVARNPEHQKAIAGISGLLHINGNMYAHMAGEAAYKHGDQWLDECLAYIQANRDFTAKWFRENLPDFPICDLQGTYLLWVDCRAAKATGEEILASLRRNGVNPTPGEFFGSPEFMRLNIATPRSLLEEALVRFKKGVCEASK